MKLCVNGCKKPIAKPSTVICKDCLDSITQRLEKMVYQRKAVLQFEQRKVKK